MMRGYEAEYVMDMALWSKQTKFEPTLTTLKFTVSSTCMPSSTTDLHATRKLTQQSVV